MSDLLRPVRAWYVIAVLISLVGGCGVAGLGLWRAYDKVTTFPRAAMPGELRVPLERGSYTIFWEPRSVVDGEAFMSQQANVRCKLARTDGHAAALSTGGVSVSYSMGSYQGKSMFDADVDEDGDYTLTCVTDDGARVVMAIGQGLGTTIALSIVCGIGGFAAGVVIFLVVYFRRRKARQRQAEGPEARVVST
jgi:hypothetical protein